MMSLSIPPKRSQRKICARLLTVMMPIPNTSDPVTRRVSTSGVTIPSGMRAFANSSVPMGTSTMENT